MGMALKPGDTVQLRTIKERGQNELDAKKGSSGIILARRVVDGSGPGYIVQFPDKTTCWFFEDELQSK
jgi:hypothetical protein